MNSNPLSDMYFAKIFSQSVACLFILLAVSFAVLKVFILMKSSVIVFLSWIVSLVLHLKSQQHTPDHLDFLVCTSSLRVLCFTWWSVIHFELIFVNSVGLCLHLFFLHVAVQLSQLLSLSLLHGTASAPLSTIA